MSKRLKLVLGIALLMAGITAGWCGFYWVALGSHGSWHQFWTATGLGWFVISVLFLGGKLVEEGSD